ncbi:hypothetical protein Tco_0958108 [Tanacetum coccineum]
MCWRCLQSDLEAVQQIFAHGCFFAIGLMRDLSFGLRMSLNKNRRLIAELEALGHWGDALRYLDYLREMVSRDYGTLGVLEQLLAEAHVGMRLKDGYVADMEQSE